jgi:hypothetical protein
LIEQSLKVTFGNEDKSAEKVKEKVHEILKNKQIFVNFFETNIFMAYKEFHSIFIENLSKHPKLIIYITALVYVYNSFLFEGRSIENDIQKIVLSSLFKYIYHNTISKV